MTVQRAINWIQCDHFGRKFRIFGKNHLGPWLTVNFCWPNCYSRFIDLNAFYPNWPACRLTLNKHKMCIWSICHSVNPEICFIIFGPNAFQNIPKFDEKILTANLFGQYTFKCGSTKNLGLFRSCQNFTPSLTIFYTICQIFIVEQSIWSHWLIHSLPTFCLINFKE